MCLAAAPGSWSQGRGRFSLRTSRNWPRATSVVMASKADLAYRTALLRVWLEARDGAQSAAQELGGELFAAFEEVVRETVEAGRMSGDASTTAQAIWASGHGVVSLMITKPYFPWAERERLIGVLLDALFAGMQRR